MTISLVINILMIFIMIVFPPGPPSINVGGQHAMPISHVMPVL